MSKSLGAAATPVAVRAARQGWRDPRLWVGIALVAASVLVGAKVVGDADASVAVWAVSDDMGPGDSVGAGDVLARNVRFVQAGDADRYLTADEPLPPGARLTRDVGAGELLPRSAVGLGPESRQRTLTFEFEGAGVPAGLARGDRVQVYVTSVEKEPKGAARLVLTDLVVTDLTRSQGSLAGAGGRAVTVGIPADADADALALVVQAAKTGNVYLVKQG